jgi:hypothetical protein
MCLKIFQIFLSLLAGIEYLNFVLSKFIANTYRRLKHNRFSVFLGLTTSWRNTYSHTFSVFVVFMREWKESYAHIHSAIYI